MSNLPFITYKHFLPSEHLLIMGNSLYDATKKLGQEVSPITKRILEKISIHPRKEELLSKAEGSLQFLEYVSRRNILNIRGVNYAQRYLETIYGYSDGVGITPDETTFLQLEIEASCQTIFVKDHKTKALTFLHTEENAEDSDIYSGPYNYQIVKMLLPNQSITFFAYPGLCSWGPAFGINETTRMIQAVDDLMIEQSHFSGFLWANAIAFMILDCGKPAYIAELISAINEIIDDGLIGGYAAHIATYLDEPTVQSIEFAKGEIVYVDPLVTPDRDIVAQANYPRHEPFQKYSSAYLDYRNPNNFSDETMLLHLEMVRRQKHLETIASGANWPFGNAKESLQMGLELLADPYGDLQRYKDSNGGHKYYHTGLPSMWTAAHFLGYIDKNECSFYIGKKTPEPIPGKEYMLTIDEHYPYSRGKLWEIAQQTKQKYQPQFI